MDTKKIKELKAEAEKIIRGTLVWLEKETNMTVSALDVVRDNTDNTDEEIIEVKITLSY